ncbi:MAG: RNA-binding domain-containing protein [Promethearchaeota archaeon]
MTPSLKTMVISLSISMNLYPTEEKEKLINLFNFFYPFESIAISEPDNYGISKMSAEIIGKNSLSFLFTQVRKQRTVEAMRRFVLPKIDFNNQNCKFMIHKQALSRGLVIVCETKEESPLGPVYLEINANKIEEVIEYLFPPTEKGRVLEVDYSIEELD